MGGYNVKNKRSAVIVAILFSVVSLLVSSSVWAAPAGWVQVDEFLIGAVNHITGPTALSGVLRKNGYELGMDHANKAGGVEGLPVKVVYEDDQGTNPGAVAATRKMLATQPIVALMIDRSPMVHSVAPIILEEKLPTLFGGSAWSISELKNPWYFRIRLDDKNNAAIMGKFIVTELKKTKIASLYCADAFGEGGHNETQAYLKAKHNITPVAVQKFTPGTKDYTAQLLAIKSSGAEVIYSWATNAEDAAIILRQFKQLGLGKTMAFMGSASYGSSVTIDIAGANANDVYTVFDFSKENKRPELQSWYKAYVEKYKDDPDFWGQNTYDGIRLIVDAAKRAGVVRKEGGKYYMMPLPQARAAIANALRATKDYKGAQADYTCDEWQNMVHSMTVLRIVDQKPKLLKVVNLD